MQFAVDLAVRHAGHVGSGGYDVTRDLCIPEPERPT